MINKSIHSMLPMEMTQVRYRNFYNYSATHFTFYVKSTNLVFLTFQIKCSHLVMILIWTWPTIPTEWWSNINAF